MHLISQQYRTLSLRNDVSQQDRNNSLKLHQSYPNNTALEIATNLMHVDFLGLHSWWAE
jgi:hypothetical protein